jgi:hypothetical protein
MEELARKFCREARERSGLRYSTLYDTTQTAAIQPLTVTQPIQTGDLAGRRLVITTSGTVPQPGDQVALMIPATVLVDSFLNQPAQPYTLTFTWPASDTVVADLAPPVIERLTLQHGVLQLEVSAEPNVANASAAIQLDGSPLSWTLAADHYTLQSRSQVTPGPHILTLSTSFTDLGGRPRLLWKTRRSWRRSSRGCSGTGALRRTRRRDRYRGHPTRRRAAVLGASRRSLHPAVHYPGCRWFPQPGRRRRPHRSRRPRHSRSVQSVVYRAGSTRHRDALCGGGPATRERLCGWQRLWLPGPAARSRDRAGLFSQLVLRPGARTLHHGGPEGVS